MNIESFRHMLPQTIVKGDIIPMTTTNDSHWNDLVPYKADESSSFNFAKAFDLALQQVNDQQIDAQDLTQKMVADPNSVQAHTVMIAMEKARMSITFAKTVTDMAVKTYKELVNLR